MIDKKKPADQNPKSFYCAMTHLCRSNRPDNGNRLWHIGYRWSSFHDFPLWHLLSKPIKTGSDRLYNICWLTDSLPFVMQTIISLHIDLDCFKISTPFHGVPILGGTMWDLITLFFKHLHKDFGRKVDLTYHSSAQFWTECSILCLII